MNKKNISDKINYNLHTWNHNSFGNPHEQYVTNNKDIAIRPYNTNGKYYKLLSIDLEDPGVSQFNINFDVYESSHYGHNNIDDKWRLSLKIGYKEEKNNINEHGITHKLIGKNRRAILICTKSSIIKKDVKIETKNENGDSEYSLEDKVIPAFHYDLYIELQSANIYFVTTFLESSTKNYKIYDRGFSINEIPYTKEEASIISKEIETLNDIIKTNENTEAYISDKELYENMITKVNENIVSKTFSRNNDDIEYKSPNRNDGIRCIKLFDIDLNNKNIYLGKIFTVFELYTYYSKEYSNYKRKYLKFSIFGENTLNDEVEFSIDKLDSINFNDSDIFITKNNNVFTFWFKDYYPCNIILKQNVEASNECNIIKLSQDFGFLKYDHNDEECIYLK